jgi:hypothetical protein
MEQYAENYNLELSNKRGSLREVKMIILIGILIGAFFVGSVVMVVIANREDINELPHTNKVIPVKTGIQTSSLQKPGAIRN